MIADSHGAFLNREYSTERNSRKGIFNQTLHNIELVELPDITFLTACDIPSLAKCD
jgi:hypothetical protein